MALKEKSAITTVIRMHRQGTMMSLTDITMIIEESENFKLLVVSF